MAPKIRFVHAPHRRELDEIVLDLLETRIDRTGFPQFLYLSPTRRKTRETAGRLRRKRRSWRPFFFVPMELAQRMVEDAGDEKPVVSFELKALLIREIVEEAIASEAVERLRFPGGSVPMGVARHLAHALEALSRRGVSPLEEGSGLRPGVAEDVAFVQERYVDLLKKHERCDPSEIPRRAVQLLGAGDAPVPASLQTLILDGFVAPEVLEARFLHALVEAFDNREVIVTVPERLLRELETQGWDGLSPEMRFFARGRDFFEALGLTEASAAGVAPPPGFDGVTARSTPVLKVYVDRASEVKGIARAVKRLVSSDDESGRLSPDQVHIVVPNIDPYYRLFIELFPRYGIPFNITRGIPLSSIPVVGLLLALMDAVIHRDYQALFRLFSSELVVPPPAEQFKEEANQFLKDHAGKLEAVTKAVGEIEFTEERPRCLDIRAVDRFCREAGVRGGRDLVDDWLIPAIRHFETKLLQERATEDPDARKDVRVRFQEICGQIFLLHREFNHFDECDGDSTVKSRVNTIHRLVSRYGIDTRLITSLATIESRATKIVAIMREKNVKGFSRGLALLDEIAGDLLIAGRDRPPLETLRNIFWERCRIEMIQEAGELAGVSISQLLEARSLARPVVLMGGLTADSFPPMPASDFLMSGGPDSDAFARSIDESRFILGHILRNSSTAILSYPESDEDEVLQPSPFVEELMRRGELNVEERSDGDAAVFCAHEVKEAVGGVCIEGEPLPWDKILSLIEQYPVSSDSEVERFHRDIRSALSASLMRSRMDRNGTYDGMLTDQRGLQTIGGLLDRPSFAYSGTMLNDYIRCPLAFFFKRVLALAPPREVPEEPEQSLIGTVVHEILARFYTFRCEEGSGRITRLNRTAALPVMLRTVEEVSSEYDFLSADNLDSWAVRQQIYPGLYTTEALEDPDLRRRVESGTDLPKRKRGILRMLVDYEAERDLPLEPWAAEHPFGSGENAALTLPGANGRDVRIHGKIDRIDLFHSPQSGKAEAAWVLDYKTGRVPSGTDVEKRRDLQIQVYLLAVLDIFKDQGIDRAGGCFIELKQGEDDLWKVPVFIEGFTPPELSPPRKKKVILAPDDMGTIRSDILDIDERIRAGVFPRTSDASYCERCEYVDACFRDDHRVRTLSQS